MTPNDACVEKRSMTRKVTAHCSRKRLLLLSYTYELFPTSTSPHSTSPYSTKQVAIVQTTKDATLFPHPWYSGTIAVSNSLYNSTGNPEKTRIRETTGTRFSPKRDTYNTVGCLSILVLTCSAYVRSILNAVNGGE